MSAREFSIPVSSLDAGGRTFHFPVRAAWVRGVLEKDSAASGRGPHLPEATASNKDGSLDVRVSRSGNDVVVHGTLKAELVAPCARCLEPVTFTVDQPVSALMVPAAQVKNPNGEYEFTAEEADTLPYDGETVILDDLVKDELVLETPMIPLCREDCPGISPISPAPASAGGEPASEKSGKEPIDPRLLPLLRLKQNIKE